MANIFNRAGKVIEFKDGSTVDLKALLSNSHNYQLTTLSISQINIIKEYENLKNEDKSPSVSLSERTLQQSIRIYGMVQPLLIGRIVNNDGTNQFILLDGYKRYSFLKEDEVKEVKCLIADIPASSVEIIIRFLSNQHSKFGVIQSLKAAEELSAQTSSIKKNFIEPALGLKMNDLTILRKAKNSDDIQVKRVYQRYIEETTDINALRRVVEKADKGETRDVIYRKRAENDNKNGLIANNNPLISPEDKEKELERLKEVRPDRNVASKELSTEPNKQDTSKVLNGQIGGENVHPDKEDKSFKNAHAGLAETGQGFGVDAEGAKILEREPGNKASIHPQQNKNNESNHQKVGERQILPRELRLEVLSRDENRCQVCGVGGKKSPSLASTFELHHMIDVQYGGSDKSDNLLTLCPLCHRLITTYGAQKKYILHGLKPYNPTDKELDNNSLFWTIPILGAIEQYANRIAIDQLKMNNRNLYLRVAKKHTMTIGQALAEYNKNIQFNFSPYKILQYGKLRLLKTKGKFGFYLFNQKLIDKYESYGDSIIEDNHDQIHSIIDNLTGYNNKKE